MEGKSLRRSVFRRRKVLRGIRPFLSSTTQHPRPSSDLQWFDQFLKRLPVIFLIFVFMTTWPYVVLPVIQELELIFSLISSRLRSLSLAEALEEVLFMYTTELITLDAEFYYLPRAFSWLWSTANPGGVAVLLIALGQWYLRKYFDEIVGWPVTSKKIFPERPANEQPCRSNSFIEEGAWKAQGQESVPKVLDFSEESYTTSGAKEAIEKRMHKLRSREEELGVTNETLLQFDHEVITHLDEAREE